MSVICSTMSYSGATVKVAKLLKNNNVIIQGSADGNRYDQPYSATTASGFSDKLLIADGYTEVLAGNGGIFYQYDNQYYAEGLEVIQGGINNQDFNMSCVSQFNNCMAIGFLKNGGMVFDKQINLINNINQYYSALTFAFGIMKDGQKAEWGKTEHSSQYSCISGRTILGQNDDYIFALSISGTTGKTGLKGNQLFALCQKLGMLDAGCFDGGGSVWLRVNGSYKNSTSRSVKNAWMIFTKKAKNDEKLTESERDGMFYLKVSKGTYKKNGKSAIPTRATSSSKYDTCYPLYQGEVFGVVGDPVDYKGQPTYQIGTGSMKGRWVLLEEDDMKSGYFIPVVKS